MCADQLRRAGRSAFGETRRGENARETGNAHLLVGKRAHRTDYTPGGSLSWDYRDAVLDAFGEKIAFAQLEKYYGKADGKSAEARYSPPKCIGTRKVARIGDPDPAHISTSFIERQNLTLRMRNRRFTRLTNAFSKKWTNHEHAIPIHYFVYNFVRLHMTLGQTPAMAAGIDDHGCTVDELVSLLEREEGLRGNGGRINREDRA